MKIVFLDRDGVINIDYGYVHKTSDFIFSEGIFKTLSKLSSRGFKFIIITNQSGIARGLFEEKDFINLSKWMIKKFSNYGIEILDIFYCPHGPNDNCICRKPKSGLYKEAHRKYNFNINKSWSVGDSYRDIEAAQNFGIKNTILISKTKDDKAQIRPKFLLKSVKKLDKLII